MLYARGSAALSCLQDESIHASTELTSSFGSFNV